MLGQDMQRADNWSEQAQPHATLCFVKSGWCVASWFGAEGSGCRVWGAGSRVLGSRFRVKGLGFRVQGSEFRVCGLGV